MTDENETRGAAASDNAPLAKRGQVVFVVEMRGGGDIWAWQCVCATHAMAVEIAREVCAARGHPHANYNTQKCTWHSIEPVVLK